VIPVPAVEFRPALVFAAVAIQIDPGPASLARDRYTQSETKCEQMQVIGVQEVFGSING